MNYGMEVPFPDTECSETDNACTITSTSMTNNSLSTSAVLEATRSAKTQDQGSMYSKQALVLVRRGVK